MAPSRGAVTLPNSAKLRRRPGFAAPRPRSRTVGALVVSRGRSPPRISAAGLLAVFLVLFARILRMAAAVAGRPSNVPTGWIQPVGGGLDLQGICATGHEGDGTATQPRLDPSSDRGPVIRREQEVLSRRQARPATCTGARESLPSACSGSWAVLPAPCPL